MTTHKEALKLALEALKGYRRELNDGQPCDAEQYIEKLLAQPEQEPVAWMDIDEKGFGYGLRYWSEPDNRHEVPLYTTPPQRTWVGLTDEDVRQCSQDVAAGGKENCVDRFAYAIEAKLKENNT